MGNLSLFFLLVSGLLLSDAAFAGSIPDDLRLPSTSAFPRASAKKLIRALNLIPKDASPESTVGFSSDASQNRIFERRFRFPGLSDGISVDDLGHHAGYYKIKTSTAYRDLVEFMGFPFCRMFYLFFESRNSKKDPIVIWLTGGPGCSSELAVFYENGPFSIADNMSLVWNQFGWDQCEGSLCYDFSNMEKFLNLKSVRETLGVGDIEFVSCSPTVYEAMLTDWMRNLEVGIPALLEDGIQLLVYAGEYDLICNWLGHMVPMDQPMAALEMLRRWTQGKLAEDSTTGSLMQQLFAVLSSVSTIALELLYLHSAMVERVTFTTYD
ncbi:hypothetical protein BHM03_00014710 [Ensete ventricosum]|uniref:Carboxypeptidase n=1 Tax=Ensete ventricosum TaxID=4639 RepID=A0A445ME87_ENSVE|nr:hypothetical protein BHM03_00014710 [Ensete ventricosum]